jgi:signal transduction histidine kinase
MKLMFFLLLLALGVGAAGYAAWLWAANQRLRRVNEALRDRLRRSPTPTRSHVTAELHENLSTKVSVLKWRLEALDPQGLSPADRSGHAELLRLMGDVYEDVRLLAHDLRPPELKTHGLSTALHKLVGQLNRGTRVRFELSTGPTAERLPREQEDTLYAEALDRIEDALHHAADPVVTLELRGGGRR